MKLATLGFGVIAACAAIVPLMASTLDDKVAALKKAMDSELALKGDVNTTDPRFGNPRAAASSLDQIVAQLNSPNSRNADAQISQILTLFTSNDVQKAGQTLLVEIRAEQKARAEAAVADAESLLKRTATTVNKATMPEDLDAILLELQKFKSARENAYNSQYQALYQRVSGAFEFTKLWQSYLSHSASKQWQLAYHDLESLSQSNCLEIVPRSRILAMLAPQKTASADADGDKTPDYNAQTWEIIHGIKDLNDLGPAGDKLDALREKAGLNAPSDMYWLESMIQSYRDIKAGLPTNISADLNSKGQEDYLSPVVRQQLLLFVLKHYLSPYKGAAPGATETPDEFVDRVMLDAAHSQNWALLKQALTAQNYLHPHSDLPTNSSQEALTALDQLLAGMNQEDASQFTLAVVSYQNALKNLPARLVPPKMIGERLAEIQKNHPAEYEQGMHLYIAPPVSRQYYPGMMGYPGMQGYPGYPMPPARPSLAIPATTNPAPAASATNTPPQAPSPATNSPPPQPTPLPTNAVTKPAPPSPSAPSTE